MLSSPTVGKPRAKTMRKGDPDRGKRWLEGRWDRVVRAIHGGGRGVEGLTGGATKRGVKNTREVTAALNEAEKRLTRTGGGPVMSDSMSAASDLLKSRLTLIHRGLKGVAAAQAAFDACNVDIQLKLDDRPSGSDPDNAKRRRYDQPRRSDDGTDNQS